MIAVCCNQNARFVDNGPRLQYLFCDVCKKEVIINNKEDHAGRLKHLEEENNWVLSQYDIDALFSGQTLKLPKTPDAK